MKTPNLDKLATEGVRFERAYCESPVCTPSRLTIMTGMSARQHGALTNGSFLPETIPTVCSVLRDAGYRTKACGKMHLQPWNNHDRERRKKDLPHMRSWEESAAWQSGEITSIPEGFFGFESTDFIGGHISYFCGDYANWLKEASPEWTQRLAENQHGPVAWYHKNPDQITPESIADCWRSELPLEFHHNTWITNRTLDYLDSLGDDEDFFLWCSYPDPHHPFAASRPYSEMYDPDDITLPENLTETAPDIGIPKVAHGLTLDQFNETGLREMLAQTYGMITHIDDCVGQIIEKLKASGRYENTVIVFMADHGDYLGSHHMILKGKYPYEELVRVPYIWRSPESMKNVSKTESTPVSLLDFAPTVLDYAGADVSALQPHPRGPVSNEVEIPWIGGTSLAGRIDGKAELDERAFIIQLDETSGNRLDSGRMFRGRCFIDGRYKMTIHNRGEGQLFDLEEDPKELNNLWNAPASQSIKNALLLKFLQEEIWTEWAGVGRIGGA